MSTSSGTTDINVKYQRLASEFAKLRSQVSVLKTAVVDEQAKSTRLQDELSEKETTLRKLQDENEGLLFRNKQLVKTVETLQKLLDEATKPHSTKGKKKQKDANLQLFVNMTDQPTNIPGTSTGTDKLQLFEQEIQRQQVVISELESKISNIQYEHVGSIEKLNGKLAGLEAENVCLKQKLKDSEELEIQRKNSIKSTNKVVSINGIDDQPKQNGTMIEKPIESATTQNVNSVPSTILSNHTKRIFDEANRLKAEYGGCVASLEHELEILRKWRDQQTTAADSIDPMTKSVENCMNGLFREKIRQLSIDLRFAQGESAYYKDECDALLTGTKALLERKPDEKPCSNCASLKEALENSRDMFENQMRDLYDQLNSQQGNNTQSQNSHNQQQSKEGPSSLKQSFRRMIGK